MFYILVTVLFLLPVFAGAGHFFTKNFGVKDAGLSLQMVTGIFSIAIIWQIAAFVVPLDIVPEMITVVLGYALFFLNGVYRNYYGFISRQSWRFYGVLLTVLFMGSFFPFILDHFGYYVPTVKWIHELGLVRGVAGLDLLLGQMSLWHVLQGGFSGFSDPFLRLNVLVLAVYVFYIFEKKRWIHLCFLPVLFLFSQSPSPDLPVLVFSLMILDEFFSENKNFGLLFVLSAFVFAIKPTMIWLPLFAFLYPLLRHKTGVKFAGLGFFVGFLYVLKNLWVFGFPFFPMQILDPGLPWKPAAEVLKKSATLAIEKTYDMQFTYAEIQQFTAWEYIRNWFLLNGVKSVIHTGFIVTLVFLGWWTWRKKDQKFTLLFLVVLIKSFLVLWFSAQYRFFIDVFFVVAFVIFYLNFPWKAAFALFTAASLLVATALSAPQLVRTAVPSFKLGYFMMGFQPEQWYRPSYFALDKYRSVEVGNLKFNVVEGYPFSFDTALPAITPEFIIAYVNAGVFPQKAGDGLRQGFVMKKLSSEDKKKLEALIHDLEAASRKTSK